jgi:hypothetical protein
VAKAVRQQSMKGLQDYSLPLENTTAFGRYIMVNAQRAAKVKFIPISITISFILISHTCISISENRNGKEL